MRLLGRVLVALIAVALGWLAVASTEIAASTPVQAELAYTYDTQCSVGLSTHTTTERGPPPTDFNGTTYDPDSLRPLGASVRSDGPGPLAVTTYIDPSGLGRVAQATGTTGGQARYLDGDVSSLSGTRCAAETGTPLYRGINETHHAYQEALNGQAWPGDVLGHSDGVLHAAGLTENSALTSWTTDRAIAEGFARGDTGRGVILRTTVEEQAHRIAPGPNALGEAEVLLRGVVFDARLEMFGW